MSDRIDALRALLAKVEAGESPSRSEWREVFPNTPEDDDYPQSMMAASAAVGWIDAARALHQAVLPDEGWEVWRTGKYPGMIPGSCSKQYAASVGWGRTHRGEDDDPARAWLMAILKALIEKEG